MEKINIICYKHSGEFHRLWQQVEILEKTEEMLVVYSKKTKIVETDGRFWFSKEPAISFYFYKRWYNIIAILKKDGSILYYINLASPIVEDSEGIKYIDYDLDIKYYEDETIELLDEDEFLFRVKYYHYPKNIISIVKKNVKNIFNEIRNLNFPFDRNKLKEKYL